MLYSSRLRSYAHALREAQTRRKAISSKARALGLTAESSIKALDDLHTLHIAEGLPAVGRKLIADSSGADSQHVDNAYLGYLYQLEFAEEDADPPVFRTHGSSRFRLEPKLMLRFAHSPDLDNGLDAFVDAIDAMALSAELQFMPFAEGSWCFEDKICANGFGTRLIAGEMKTLSRSSKRNFDQLLNLSSFSLSRVSAAGSALVSYQLGHQTRLSSIAALYALLKHRQPTDAGSPIAEGQVVALDAVCDAQPVAAGEEWVCVSTGFDLGSLRISFTK